MASSLHALELWAVLKVIRLGEFSAMLIMA